MSLFTEVLETLGTVETFVVEATTAKSDIEGVVGHLLIKKELVTDTVGMAKRLLKKTEEGDPPTTFDFAMELGSFLTKDRKK